MNYPATGYHHITACAGGAQEDVNFFTGIVGQRLAKQTVLMDGKLPHYHLYYSNANIEPGSIMTTFPYSRKPGKRGSGQVQSITYTVSKGSLPFWLEHFKKHKIEHSPIEERFGQRFIRFSHPAGLSFEVMEDKDDTREGWTTKEIGAVESVRGFHGTVLSVRDVSEQEKFLIEAIGFRKTGVDGAYHRFEISSGGANKTLTLLHEPDRAPGQLDVWRRNRPSPGALGSRRRRYRGAEGDLRGARLHGRLRNQGSVLFPLDVRSLAGRYSGRVLLQCARRIRKRRKGQRTGHQAPFASVVRRSPQGDSGHARAHRGSGGFHVSKLAEVA